MTYALVIDDNRVFADSLCQMLEYFNIEAEAVYGPWSGITASKDKMPTMIFLDINMPGVNGFQVLEYLKREPQLSEAPVFIVSSEAQDENVKRALQEGAEAFIPKPVSLDELEKVLRAARLIG